MSQVITYCVVGCTVRGQHIEGCDRDECRGCQPRMADRGGLCAFCHQRLQTDVATIPDLVRHLRIIGAPHAQVAPPSDGRAYRDPAEGSILPAAWTAADELHAMLASWALTILEEHPDGYRMVGPDEVGAWHTRYGTTVGIQPPGLGSTVRNGRAPYIVHEIRVAPMADAQGEPILYLSEIRPPEPTRVVDATSALVAWLTPLLDWCAGQEWAGVMREEVSAAVGTTSARWPTAAMVEPERPVSMPCPRCEHMSLRYSPPSVERAPFKVSCSNPDCARIWTEDEWEWLVTMVTKGERMGS